MANELGIGDDDFRTFGIFNSYAVEKQLSAKRTNQRFVYYTTADTAVKIIKNKEIWMRKSHLMNDYREIEHGFDCLHKAYKNHGSKMRSIFDAMFPGFCERLAAALQDRHVYHMHF
jgi:hypothetical protein